MKKFILSLMIALFINSLLFPYARGHAASLSNGAIVLPKPGLRIALSKTYMPVMLKGVLVDPKDPFKFNFIVDSGDTGLKAEQLNEQGMKLVKYFLAALTVPEEEMWVNLSPYEKDKIISKSFGATEMGRDLLAQDYVLKQLSASLTYPEEALGKKFWDQVYKRINDQYGNVVTGNIPTNTFNKVWIMPDRAQVYEQKNGAFVVEAKLKVMLDEDLNAKKKNHIVNARTQATQEIIREIILPELEQQVNEGEHFSSLRQAYQAMILAAWYKIRLKESILGKLYVNQGKTDGISLHDQTANQKIYDQYVHAFKKGVYNYIKDIPEVNGQVLPRKYFSGGLIMKTESLVGSSLQNQNSAMHAQVLTSKGALVSLMVTAKPKEDAAMVEMVEHSDLRQQLSEAIKQFWELDLVDRVSEQSQFIKQEIADIIQESVEEVFHSHRKYPKTYLEVIVKEDKDSKTSFPAFSVVIKNRDGKYDGIEVNGGTMEQYYHNLHILLRGSKFLKPLLNGMMIIKEAKIEDLEHATRGMRSDHDWEVKFTIGFKDNAMHVTSLNNSTDISLRHLVPFSEDLLEFFTSVRARYRVYLLSENLDVGVDSFKQFLSVVKGENWMDQIFVRHIDQVLDKLKMHTWRPKVISIKSKAKTKIKEDVGLYDVIDFLDGNEFFWSDGVLFITIKSVAEKLAKDNNNQVNIQTLSAQVKEILLHGIYRDLFEESLDEHLEVFMHDTANLANQAMQSAENLGGIDLNAKELIVQVKRDDKGVVLPISSQPLNHIRIQGLFPVILNISAVPSLQDFLN